MRGGIQLRLHRDSARVSLITKKIGLAALVCALVLFAGACGSAGNGPTSAASDAPSLSGAKSPVAEPTFTYPGGPQCKITYRDNGNGTMSWTADVTIAGELITHASDTSGNINRHDEQVTVGLNTFTAPVPPASARQLCPPVGAGRAARSVGVPNRYPGA